MTTTSIRSLVTPTSIRSLETTTSIRNLETTTSIRNLDLVPISSIIPLMKDIKSTTYSQIDNTTLRYSLINLINRFSLRDTKIFRNLIFKEIYLKSDKKINKRLEKYNMYITYKLKHIDVVILLLALTCKEIASECWSFIGEYFMFQCLKEVITWNRITQDIINCIFKSVPLLHIPILSQTISNKQFTIFINNKFLIDDILMNIFIFMEFEDLKCWYQINKQSRNILESRDFKLYYYKINYKVNNNKVSDNVRDKVSNFNKDDITFRKPINDKTKQQYLTILMRDVFHQIPSVYEELLVDEVLVDICLYVTSRDHGIMFLKYILNAYVKNCLRNNFYININLLEELRVKVLSEATKCGKYNIIDQIDRIVCNCLKC